jgi:hypothetical protein
LKEVVTQLPVIRLSITRSLRHSTSSEILRSNFVAFGATTIAENVD